MALVDYFLKIDGVDGESTDAKHAKEIDVESWSWGESNQGVSFGGGSGTGKVSMQDFHFTMKVSAASPKLVLACATGEHFKKAVLTCRRAGKEQQEYLIITMEDVLISSYQTGGSQGDVVPVDSFSTNFAKIVYEYKPQKPDGTLGSPVKVGYDLKANKKV